MTPRYHRQMTAPIPRRFSRLDHLTMIRNLETAGVLPASVAERARAKVEGS